MFTKILIANRGEIACRIMRTAKRVNIKCVAVYSEADKNALHTRMADEAIAIGPAASKDSYLNGANIIAAALKTGAQAIHPGYGFLSENADFAEACVKAGLVFIGPPASAIRAMGSKSAAKNIMEKAGVPLIAGYHGEQQDLASLMQAATKIGFPVLLKASAGGGGKGMRVVTQASQIEAAIHAAKREALASFGNDQLLIEKYLAKPRHIEIQVFADQQGNVIHLFERDCSIQRRHQKIIEEAPAPFMSDKIREQMGNAAISAAKAIGYVGAGTIEFLFDEDKNFYFMEMNTRLQVEHPVTEMITQQDLVEWQLKIAYGETLPLRQKQLKIYGHAFEARIYAEDPENDFLPSIGTIKNLITPKESSDVRIDTGVTAGDEVSHYYDPMLAKLITWGKTRDDALLQMQNALAEYQVIGITTNLDLLSAITCNKDFAKGLVETHFISEHQADLFKKSLLTNEIICAASLFIILQQKKSIIKTNQYSPWDAADSWQLNLAATQTLKLTCDLQTISTTIIHQADNQYRMQINNKDFNVIGSLNTNHLEIAVDGIIHNMQVLQDQNQIFILNDGKRFELTLHDNNHQEIHNHGHLQKSSLAAPMHGKVVALIANIGSKVAAGSELAIIEAMKMEHAIHAPADGFVKEWYFAVGDIVNEGQELLSFEEIN